jgi:hypothetical protein
MNTVVMFKVHTIDVRGDGGYVFLPSPGNGYFRDPVYGPDTPFAPPPDWLWPPKPSRPIARVAIRPVAGLPPYAEAAIEEACTAIVRAGPGIQEQTLNAECFSIGTLADAGMAPADLHYRRCCARPTRDARP